MVKLFDATFMLGTVLVVLAVGIAVAAIAGRTFRSSAPASERSSRWPSSGWSRVPSQGASQAPMAGWTDPAIVLGVVLGVVALVVVAAGVLGWAGVLQPVSQFVPGDSTTRTPARTATAALGALIAVKWVVATVMAAIAR